MTLTQGSAADLQVHESQTQKPTSQRAGRQTRRTRAALRGELSREDLDAADVRTGSAESDAPQSCESAILEATSFGQPADSLHADDQQTALDAPASPLPSATPTVIASLRRDAPGKRTASNKENVEPAEAPFAGRASLTHRRVSTYDALEDAVVQALTPPATSRQPSSYEVPVTAPMPQLAQPAEPAAPVKEPRAASPTPTKQTDSVVAMDAQSQPVDDGNAQGPSVEPTTQEPALEKPKAAENERNKVTKAKSSKPTPVVRATKASQYRISIAHPDKIAAGKLAAPRPRASTTLGASISSKRVPSTSSKKPEAENAEDESREKKEMNIPHSKPRPVSLSFPTPPPPPKSKKAPTTSTFQLPGEAVAAKLKAAREARLAKEAEDAQKKKDGLSDEKKPVFKARPVPAGLSKAPSVRQTNASKARESLMASKGPGALPATGASGAHKRANSVATSRLSSAPKPRTKSSKDPSPNPAAKPSSSKRPSTALANISKPRASISTSSTAPAPAAGATAPPGTTKSTTKGKEVFKRAASAREQAEKEKREKEEAAKKARAAAAERGRQLSKEWAEKQKLKKMGGNLKTSVSGEGKKDGQATAGSEKEEVKVESQGNGQVAVEA
jgi:hypothetical protein